MLVLEFFKKHGRDLIKPLFFILVGVSVLLIVPPAEGEAGTFRIFMAGGPIVLGVMRIVHFFEEDDE